MGSVFFKKGYLKVIVGLRLRVIWHGLCFTLFLFAIIVETLWFIPAYIFR